MTEWDFEPRSPSANPMNTYYNSKMLIQNYIKFINISYFKSSKSDLYTKPEYFKSGLSPIALLEGTAPFVSIYILLKISFHLSVCNLELAEKVQDIATIFESRYLKSFKLKNALKI